MTHDSLPLHYFSKDLKKFLKKGKSKGLLYGNFGAHNVGDEAILSGELIELQKIPTTTVTVVSRFPDQVKKQHKVNAIAYQNIVALLRELFFSNYLIIGGGGLFCKNDSGAKGIMFQLYTIILFLYLPIFLRKKVFVLGLGFYKNTNRIISALASFGLSYASILAVRDDTSYSYLKSKKLPVKIYKDNSFLMPLSSYNSNISNKGVTKFYIVGIAVNAPEKFSDRENLAKELAVFINKYAHSTHFVMYPLDSHPGYYNDKKFAKEILRRVKGEVSYSFYPTHNSAAETFSSFKLNDFMITSRLHGSIFSFRQNIPFYAIAYDIKCDSFLNSIGHQYTHPSSVTSTDISFYYEVAKMKKKERFLTQRTSLEDITYDY